jgi:hypothetical protein
MSYQPTQDDIRCANCREWFHKALNACPMCDAPNVPVLAREPTLKIARAPLPTKTKVELWVSGIVFVGTLGSCGFMVKSCTSAPSPGPAQTPSPDTTLQSRIEAVRKIVTEAGGQIEVSSSTIRVSMPGPIEEYPAQRLAKVIGDRVGPGMVIRVLDDAGIERAKYAPW